MDGHEKDIDNTIHRVGVYAGKSTKPGDCAVDPQP